MLSDMILSLSIEQNSSQDRQSCLLFYFMKIYSQINS